MQDMKFVDPVRLAPESAPIEGPPMPVLEINQKN
jgi:hypothetical protein